MRALATIQKNSREELRVSLDDFKGQRLVSLRVWFRAEDGTMRPGRKGLAVRLELLPAVLEALGKALAEDPA